MSLPDVQARRSAHGFSLTRVGVTGVLKPVLIQRPGSRELHALHATFDVFVDLPADQRGVHMSRNLEAVNEAVDEAVREPETGLEWIASHIARVSLERHSYATVAVACAKRPYGSSVRAPLGVRFSRKNRLLARTSATVA